MLVSPVGDMHGFVDDELAKVGLSRHIALIINHFSASLPIIASSDLVLPDPMLVLKQLMTDEHVMFDCPVETLVIFRSHDLIWHKRLSRQPAQEWLRGAISRAALSVVGEFRIQ